MDVKEQLPLRERLILSGIEEIERHGIQNFSIRRAATASGVSCAAPYKHFEDKRDFLEAIISYVYASWEESREDIARQYAGDVRGQLMHVSLGFIRFLHDNPHFRSIIMLRDVELEREGRQMLLRLTDGSRALIENYCREVGMTPEVQKRKTFVVRSLIYGAALMLDNGELSYETGDMDMVEEMISREFDIA